MPRHPQRPPVSRSRPGRVLLWAAVLLLVGLFGGLAAYQVVYRDRPQADPVKQQELTQTRLTEARSATTDWPQWRGPNRDGISAETALLTDWPEGGPRTVWEQPTGEGFSSVAVAGGRVFTLVQDGEDEAVVCWDADTGAERWRHKYRCHYRNEFGNGPRSTPTVVGDLVYTVGGTGIMHCLRAFADRAEVVWKKDLLGEFGAPNLRWGIAFSPLVESDRVYVMPGGPGGNSVAALDGTTGAVLWKQHDYPGGYASPIAATLAGRRQVLFFTGTHLIGVAPEDGALLWDYPWETDYQCNIATPIVVDDYVFISSGYNKGCAVLKVEKGGDRWQASLVYKNRKMRNHFSSSVLSGGHLYGFDDSNLTCMDFRTGAVRWKERGFDKGSLLVAAGHLIIYGENGKVALAAADPQAYREQAQFKFADQGSCWSAPALANGRLYVRDQKRLVCYDVRKR